MKKPPHGMREGAFSITGCESSGGVLTIYRSILFLGVGMLQRWLHARLRSMNRIRCDFFAMVFFLLLHFFVVRDISWIGHGAMLSKTHRIGRGTKRQSSRGPWRLRLRFGADGIIR